MPNVRSGEVERLLKEYRQNQELVRRIGGHYYQIIYPVQLRHHEKMGISTREVSPPKVRKDLHKRNTRKIESNTMVCSYLVSFIHHICLLHCFSHNTQTLTHPHTHIHSHTHINFILQKKKKKKQRFLIEIPLKENLGQSPSLFGYYYLPTHCQNFIH